VSQWRVGDVSITRVIEIENAFRGTWLLPDATPEAVREVAWLRPLYAEEQGRLRMSAHSLVVRSGGLTILVDTGIGNDKDRPDVPGWHQRRGSFLTDLAAAGFPRESIDRVVCTHLHADHVGWNTMLERGSWIPTFPNARYLMGRVEFDHWTSRHDREDMEAVLADSVTPVWEAALVDLVETDHRICDEISLVPTLGHTPGHVSVRITSQGEEALITGDFMHHPCQIAKPDWSSTADNDPSEAQRTRERMLTGLSDAPILVIGTHFAGRTAGHVVRDGGAFRLAV